MAYQVKLDIFEGPIDLLLHLITRQRVEIYDVSLATITGEYLQVVSGMESVDLELATGFLLVAATLLELKSTRLLPAGPTEGSDVELLEERDLLLARLIECSTFREAGTWLASKLEEGAAFHGRSVPLEPQFLEVAPDLLERVTASKLGVTAGRVLALKPVPQLDTSHLTPIRVSVRDAIAEVSGRLASAGEMSFDELCAGSEQRMDVIVRFLALLELLKSGAVLLEQARLFGDIMARWTGEIDAEKVIRQADEYSMDQGAP
ncbi:MAG: segregation and condensation protein [Actinomycetota bacterium]|nr:segregation and condensation protein [Actinomycetota bacterium]